MSIVTDFPAWYVLLCLILGAILAGILYYKDQKNEFSSRLKIFLYLVRFLTISLIAFLLLSPLLKTLVKHSEKPIIIVAQDASSSVTINKDSAFYKNDYPDKLKSLIKDLRGTFSINEYSFGSSVRENLVFSYNDKTTDMSSLLDEIQTRYANRNVGAVIIASDGIYNKGINPLYKAEKFPFPIYTIAMGDTTVQKDILISRVNYNKTAFLGNKFPVEILFKGSRFAGSTCVLEVKKDEETLFSKQINIGSDKYVENVNLQLEAKTKGVQRYRIQLGRLDKEISYFNNQQDIFVNVLEGKEKVLILSAAPHPDIAALKSGIESNANYQVTVAGADEFTDPVDPFNLIILHQLPSVKQPMTALINKANEKGITLWYILGASTHLGLFNNLKTGLSIQQDKQSFTEAQPVLKNDFVLFNLSEETKKILADFPPLNSPYGTYRMQNASQVMLYQKIGSLVTDRPEMLFFQEPEKKTGVLAGEGLWKWRLSNYARTNNHEAFNEWLTKTVQFLSVRISKDPFRIHGNHQYQENEPVIFTAEVYNPSFELITDPEVEMTINNEEGKSFPLNFSRTGNGYQLNAGIFPAGQYTYQAQTKVGDKIHRLSGQFTVSPLQLEAVQTVADHALLFNLSTQHNGTLVNAKEAENLADILKKRDDLKTISYTQKRYNDWINLPWVFLLVLLFLTAEWFARKRAGSY